MMLIDGEIPTAITSDSQGIPKYAITNLGRTFMFDQYTGWRLMKF